MREVLWPGGWDYETPWQIRCCHDVSLGDPVGRFVNETRIWVDNRSISGIFLWYCVRYLQTDHCTSNWRVYRCIEKTSGT